MNTSERGRDMSRRLWYLAVAGAVVVASLGLGYRLGSGNSKSYEIYTGDCYSVGTTASCTVGDHPAYGVAGVVAWTDASGVNRGGPNDSMEWPTCLPSGQQTKGVRFAGATLPAGDSSFDDVIVWVDCR
jgi:hypothetical protein